MSLLVDIVAPVFGLVALGYGAAATRVFDGARLKGLAFFAFGFAIPALLLRSMARMELDGTVAWPFLFSYYLGAFAVFAAGMVLSRAAFARSWREATIAGLTCAYSNTVLLGLPLLLTVFGERASLPALLLVAFHSILMFPLATVLLESARGGATRLATIPAKTAMGLLRNPIFMGLVAGLVLNLGGVVLPGAVDAVLQMLGQAAIPCALFAMGGSLRGYSVAGRIAESVPLIAIKLLLHPFIVWLLGSQVFGLDPLWLQVAVVMAALPAGVNAYIFAQAYEAIPQVAGTTVLLGTAAAVVSVSVLLRVLAAA